MDWKEKMIKAMKDLQDACNSTPSWANCKDCPFYDYCNSIKIKYDITPASDDFLEDV